MRHRDKNQHGKMWLNVLWPSITKRQLKTLSENTQTTLCGIKSAYFDS